MASRRRSTAVRQEQIIDAARKLVVKYGSEHVTVGRIAKEVDISEGAIYRHFKSKKEVLSGLVDRLADDLLEDLKRNRVNDQTTLDIIERTLVDHLSSIKQKRGISFQVIAEIISFGDKKLNIKISKAISNYESGLKELLSNGVKTGELREDIDIEAVAMLLFCMIQGLVNIWALSNYSFDLEQKHSQLWRVFSKSIIKR